MLQSVWIMQYKDVEGGSVICLFPSHSKAMEYGTALANYDLTELGLEGVHVENHIDYALARLENFQSGALKCRENALAITHLQEARHWLEHRMHDRDNRGVLGTHES